MSKRLTRQTCCICLRSTDDYVTLAYREGTAHFHFCTAADCRRHFEFERERMNCEVVA